MAKYILIESSPINCDVYLEEDGLLDVTPLNPSQEYGFLYYEQIDEEEPEILIWHSSVDASEGPLSELPLLSPEEVDFLKRLPALPLEMWGQGEVPPPIQESRWSPDSNAINSFYDI